MKHIFLPVILLCAGFPLSAQCVFISEYLEGSGNNKCIEIFNGTGTSIDLAANGYALQVYANGNISPSSSIALSGTVAPGDVHVVCHPSADPLLLAQTDQTSGSLNMNGDDAIALVFAGATIDVVGQIGVDPGTEWAGTGCSQGTADGTLIRKPALICPAFDGLTNFDPASQWDCYPADIFSEIGAHFLASCVLYDLAVWENGCNNGTASVMLDFIAFNPGSVGFSLTISPDPAGLSGNYLYTDLPLSLTGFSGNNTTAYSFVVEDLLNAGCIADTLTGIVFDCPVADQLVITQMPPGCVAINQGLQFEVCAVESSSGKIQPDYSAAISVFPDPGANGTLSGSMSVGAVNGCAVFSLSYDLPEDISLTFSNGIFPDVQTSILPFRNQCPSMAITTAVINPCGNDSQNEYFGALTGAMAFSVDELVIASIDPLIGIQPNTNFVWSASGAENGGNSSESCGAIGLQCNRILDINHPLDSPIIHNLISQLNTQSGCSPELFVAPTGPNLGTLPAHSNVVFFLGAGGNAALPLAPGFDGLGSNLDFSGFCGQGPIYALFGYHKNPTASFGFFSNTSSRIYQIITGGNSTSEVQYVNPAGNAEAEIIDSAGIYASATDCTPLSLFQNQLLGVQWLWLEGYSPDGASVVLTWEAEITGSKGKFIVEKYDGFSKFEPIGEVKIPNKQDTPGVYAFTDYSLTGISQAYRIRYTDADGETSWSKIVEVSVSQPEKLAILSAWPNPATTHFQMKLLSPEAKKGVEIHLSTVYGKLIFICKLDLIKGVNTIALDMSDMAGGLYLYHILSGRDVITGRLVIQ